MRMKSARSVWAGLPALSVTALAGVDPWADQVIDYSPGSNANPAYLDSTTTLGSPERFTGEGFFPSVVSIFSPAYGADELVSIGEGGALTVRFDQPVVDDPAHAFGVDLIVFGNAGFIDEDFPNGSISNPATAFGLDRMRISVSADGLSFVSLGDYTEGLFPAQGYADSGPFDGAPGAVPTSFTKPVDPGLALTSFSGLTYSQALTLYDGSGGGTPIDISASGLSSIQYVRVEALEDPTRNFSIEIEAFAAVPEPATLSLTLAALTRFAFRRKR